MRRVVHIEAFIRVTAEIIITSDLILSVANVINVLPHALKKQEDITPSLPLTIIAIIITIITMFITHLEMPLKELLKEGAHDSAILGGALRWRSKVTGSPGHRHGQAVVAVVGDGDDGDYGEYEKLNPKGQV